ncbi:MAG: DNA double-strand break repair nuclease NurA [DPANN group archaeon]|nr:DNA double-strand break repair nuclease NurA [DPANN group archaeon]
MAMISKDLDYIGKSLKDWEKSVLSVVEIIRSKKDKLTLENDSQVISKSLFRTVLPDDLKSRTYIGVDGGLIKKEYHGIDIILTRAVAVKFDFKDGKLYDTQYIPGTFNEPKISVINRPMYESDFSIKASLFRINEEISIAVESLSRSPDILLLDGSVVPHPQSRPKSDSELYTDYLEIVRLYKTLYEKSIKKNIYLAGVVEDSRSTTCVDLIKSCSTELSINISILETVKDTHFLFYLLKQGEMSFVFRYSKKPDQNLVLKDIGQNGNNIYSFYMKTVEFDRPIRIDFLSETNDTDIVLNCAKDIASYVLAISTHNTTYGCPSVIIEADLRAKLNEQEISFVENSIFSSVGNLPGIFDLRRNRRPL